MKILMRAFGWLIIGLSLLGGCAGEHPKMACFPVIARLKDGSEQRALLCQPILDGKVKFVGESSL